VIYGEPSTWEACRQHYVRRLSERGGEQTRDTLSSWLCMSGSGDKCVTSTGNQTVGNTHSDHSYGMVAIGTEAIDQYRQGNQPVKEIQLEAGIMHGNSGFTLVEILIVVIILGILAAIVIPQFTEASNDARESALASDLQTIRSQVELYKIQHLDQYPGEKTPAVSGIDVDNAGFVTDLTTQTDQDGTAGTAFGPYLQSFPVNPFISDAAKANIITSGAGDAAGDDSSGWWLNTTTGKVMPNDSLGSHKTM